VLFGSDYWSGLLGWIRDFALKERKVTEADLKLLHVTDSPAEVVEVIVGSQSSLRVENSLISEIADPYRTPEKH
jgi:predicted Rossmann-fold nucleotide-binding protein